MLIIIYQFTQCNIPEDLILNIIIVRTSNITLYILFIQNNVPEFKSKYRGADESLARPDRKKQLKGHHFSSIAEVIATAETWLDGQPAEFFFLSGL